MVSRLRRQKKIGSGSGGKVGTDPSTLPATS